MNQWSYEKFQTFKLMDIGNHLLKSKNKFGAQYVHFVNKL